MAETPQRAFRLTLKLEADTRGELVSALMNLATRVDRSEVTKGIWGGPTDGGIYELHAAEHPSHEEYFAEVRKYLDEQKNDALPPPPNDSGNGDDGGR